MALLTVCRAGNSECGLKKGTSVLLNSVRPLPCDVCCAEPGFCPECKCILCSGTISPDCEWIQCLQRIGTGVCGHSAHLQCALDCNMAGVVPDCGLDIEYLCRRCDKKMDLLPRATRIMRSVAAAPTREIADKRTSFVIRLVQGTKRNPIFHNQNGDAERLDEVGDLQQGDDGFFECRTSRFGSDDLVIDPDEPLGMELDGNGGTTLCTISKAAGHDSTTLCTISKAVSNPEDEEEEEEEEGEYVEQANALITPEQLVSRYQSEIERALQNLKRAQELEYAAARERLVAQMDLVIGQYELLESSRFELSKTSPTAFEVFMENLQQNLDKLKKERALFDCMLQIGQGFGAVSRDLLRRAFNWPNRS